MRFRPLTFACIAAIIACIVVSVSLPPSRTPRASAAVAPLLLPPATTGGLIYALAAQAQPADVLPLAFTTAYGVQRVMAQQAAESAVPASRNADGPAGASAELAVENLLGTAGLTIDPRGQARARIGTILGSAANMLPLGGDQSPTVASGASNHSFALDMVDPGSGSLHLTYQDISVPARGFPLQIQRTFAPLRGASSIFGPGWSFTFGVHLSYDPYGQPRVQEADGTQTQFSRWSGTNTYLAQGVDGQETLVVQPDHSAYRLMPNDSYELFDDQGHLTREVSSAGQGLTLAYKGANLVSVVDNAGRSLRFAYGAGGVVTSITDPLKQVWRYAHGADGSLTSATDPDGRTTRFTYLQPAGTKGFATYNPVLLASVRSPRGGTISLHYDGASRVTQIAGPGPLRSSFSYSVDPSSQTLRTFVLDAVGGRTEIDSPPPANDPGTGEPVRTTKIVTPGGESSTVQRSSSVTLSQDPSGRTTLVTRDAKGLAVSAGTSGGSSSQFTFDGDSTRVNSITNGLGAKTSFSYDAGGALRVIREPDGAVTRIDPTGANSYRITDATGASVGLVTDAAGDLTRVSDALGRQLRLTWDAAGRLLAVDDPARGRFSYAYDAAGQLVSRRDAGGALTRYGYDADGNLSGVTDALGHTWRFACDARDLPVTLTDPLGHSEHIVYDAAGRRVAVVDPNGQRTTLRYDTAGRVSTTVDAGGHATKYVYDVADRLLETISPSGAVTHYTYDASGNLIASSAPTGEKTGRTYDKVGEATALKRADGVAISYHYDPQGRLTARLGSDGSGAALSYDAAGHLQAATSGKLSVRYARDAAGEITRESDAAGRATAYAYDGQGRQVSLTDPSGHLTRYRYDADGHLLAIDDPSGSSTFGYDVLGRRITATLPGGIQARYGYDAANRETSIVYRRGGSTLLQLTYSYDAVGNVTREVRGGKATRYQYDALSRLTATSGGSGGTQRYSYDAAGDLVASPAGSNWQYDASGRLTAANGVRYSYDAAGNLASSSDGMRYHFDALGHLLGVSGPHGSVSYTYDPLGRLLSRTSGKSTVTYAYDGSTPIASYAGKQETRLLNGPGVNEVLATSSSSLTTYLRDLRGSVAAWVTQGGKSTQVSSSPYGVPQTKEQAPNGLGFAGQSRDPVTGFVNLENRLYDPAHGRFISPDPIAQAGAPLYLYASDNPTSRIDPLGLCDGGPTSDDYFTKGGEAAAADGVLAALAKAEAAGTQLGVLGVGLAFAQAINCPSAANAVGLFGSTGLFALGLLMPELGLALAVAGLAFALLNERAGQKYPGYSDCGPGGPKLDNPGGGDGGGDCSAPTSNTDPTFIDPLEHPGAGHDAGPSVAAGAAEIAFPVSAPGTASMAIYNVSGTLVRSLGNAISATPPTASVKWDGLDAGHHRAAPGTYYAVIDLRAGDNPLADTYRLETINLAAGVPAASAAVPAPVQQPAGVRAQITLPSDNAMVRGIVPINGYAYGTDFDHFTVEFGPGTAPTSWTSLTSRTQPADPAGPLPLYHKVTLSGNLATLDTGLSNYHYDFHPTLAGSGLGGTYTVRLRVYGHHGEVAEARSHMLVARAAPYVTDSVVQSPDLGATLAIPSLAIHSLAQLFAIEPVTDAPPLPPGVTSAGHVYALHPAGYAFSAPVALHLTVPRAAQNVAVYGLVAGRHQWQLVPSQRSANGGELVSNMNAFAADPALYAVVKVSGTPPAPLLFAPAGSTTALATTSIAGLARPGSRVIVQVTGSRPISAMAGDDGLFSATGVALHPGVNTIRAAVAGSSGKAGQPSRAVQVTFTPSHVAVLSLKVTSADFSHAAKEPIAPGDRLGIEARIVPTANPPDGITVHVASGVKPGGFNVTMRRSGGLSYRAVVAAGAATSPDLAPDQASALGTVPVLAAFGRKDTLRITAGGHGVSLQYRDRSGPTAPALASSSHQAAIAGEFARPDGIWSADPAPLGALVDRVAVRGGPDLYAERITAGPTGEMLARVPVSPFNLAVHPSISFSYNVPSTVAVDLGIHANGIWWVLGLSDAPPAAYDTRRPFFAPIWSPGVTLARDGRWHQETINLYQALRDEIPTDPITVDRVLFGDWESASWMAVEPSHTNAPGSSYLLGSVTLPADIRQPFLHFTWSDTDPSGIAGYSYVLDQKPFTVPPAHSMGLSTKASFGPLQSGAWWLHVRAVDGAGNWGLAAHYPVVIDILPPIAGAPDPAPGKTGDALVSVRLQDAGPSGIDPSTLRFSAFGKVYGPESNAISYDRVSSTATFDLGRITPTPPQLYPGGRVPVALTAAADAAGNRLARPLSWTFTLDIPTSLPGGPQLLTTKGGEAPSFSPDGTRVAFVSSRQGGTHVWTIDAGDVGEQQGTAKRLVSGPGSDADPAWSPDGKTIAFSSTRDSRSHLWLIDADGTHFRELTSGAHADLHPTWSPDGKTIAFERDGDLWRIDASGHDLQSILVDGDHAVREPAWSHDGKLIAFRHSLYVDQIWTVHTDGTKPGPITSLGQGEAQAAPAWRADGSLSYVSQRGKVSAIYSVDPDGTDQHTLLGQPPALLFTPNAAIDGSVYGFVSNRTGNRNVWVSRDFRVTPFDTSVSSFDAAAGKNVTLTYGTSSIAKVSLDVTDADGKTVRTFAANQQQPVGQRTVTWDGKDDHGQMLPEGQYTFSMSAKAPGLPVLQRGAGVVIDNVSRHGSIRVHVALHGAPVSGASVTISRASTTAFVTYDMTGKTGVVTFSLPPGRYDVRAISNSGANGAVQGLVIATSSGQDATVELVPAPVPGVPTSTPTVTTGSSTPSTTRTPAPGTSPSATPAAGTATASATPTGATRTTETAIPTPNVSGQGVLAITVLLAPGHPGNDARVDLYSGTTRRGANYTDTNGVTTFNIKAGTYSVQVQLGDAHAPAQDFAVNAGTVTNGTVDLEAGVVHETVFTAPGHLATDARVEILQGKTHVDTAYTDSTGSVLFTVNAGSYNLVASLGSAVTAPSSVQVAAGSTVDSSLVLSSGVLNVAVQIAGGAPANGARVEVESGTKSIDGAYTDSKGLVQFSLAAGTYSLVASLGPESTMVANVHIVAGATTSQTMVLNASGTLHVTVLLAPGHVAGGARVDALQGKTEATGTYADASGQTDLTLKPGTYTVTASDGAAKPVSIIVKVAANATVRSTIVLNAGTVKITTFFAPGRVASGTRVDLFQGSSDITGGYADASGTVIFLVTGGTYTAKSSLDAATGPSSTVHVSAGGTATSSIVLNAGILNLHIVNGSGHSVNGARVDIYKGATHVTATYTDTAGMATFQLNAGSYKVTVVNGKATVSITVQIVAGNTTAKTVSTG